MSDPQVSKALTDLAASSPELYLALREQWIDATERAASNLMIAGTCATLALVASIALLVVAERRDSAAIGIPSAIVAFLALITSILSWAEFATARFALTAPDVYMLKDILG